MLTFHILSWRPVIDDSSLWNWIAVICYFAIATASYAISSMKYRSFEKTIWFAVFLLFLFFGCNKLFSLKELVAVCGRILLYSTGTYYLRRPMLFVIGLSMVIGVFFLVRVFIVNRTLLSNEIRAIIISVIYLFFFFIIRAISFHKVDWKIEHTWYLGIKLKFILEYTGIFIAGFGCVRALLFSRR